MMIHLADGQMCTEKHAIYAMSNTDRHQIEVRYIDS